MMRKNTSWKPDDANDGYSYTVITMEAVMAKNPKNDSVRAKLGRPAAPTGPAAGAVAVAAGPAAPAVAAEPPADAGAAETGAPV